MHDYRAGLDYAHQSLTYLPENPQLLVAVADVQARQHLNDEAITNARAALYYFDRFGRPGRNRGKRVAAIETPHASHREFRAGARAAAASDRRARRRKTKCAAERVGSRRLTQARTLNPDDWEIVYVLGLARLSSGDFQAAADRFRRSLRAERRTRAKSARTPANDLQDARSEDSRATSIPSWQRAAAIEAERPEAATSPEKPSVERHALPAYAGSDSCRGCHGGIYRNWSQSGHVENVSRLRAAERDRRFHREQSILRR